ncbi:hypothetical protein V9T40_008684 [Parthenolecanium corni]|uniref:Chordin n=1 Tax=Parthenolecanium corni TaxID=536013 RepID=A0AAN9TNM4_9HEMI
MQDFTPPSPTDEEEKSNKHYAALLTSTFYSMHKNGNVSIANLLGQSATGRFTLLKRNLYFSFYTSTYPLSTKPKTVQFLDSSGQILEEIQLQSSGSLYQNQTGKICGIWRRVPSEYRSWLKDEKLSVILIWEEHDVRIRGALLKHRPLPTEMFSSLMVSPSDLPTDVAGTAVISISTITPSVHVLIVYTGLLSLKRKSDVSLKMLMTVDDRTKPVFEENITVEKISTDINVVEYSTAVSASDLQALTQNRVSVSLMSARYPDSRIHGKVLPRVSCELFQSVLSSVNVNQAGTKYPQKSTKAVGITWMFIDKTGALQYFYMLDNVADASVELVTTKHQTLVENLSYPNGTLAYLSPKHLEWLYDQELAISVTRMNSNGQSLIRGRLMSRTVADSRDSPTPYLLRRTDTSVPADMVGLIWARIDVDCSFHYDISIAGKEVDEHQYEFYLEDVPVEIVGAPLTRRLFEEFSGGNAEGSTFPMSQIELSRLESGVVYLDIWDMKRGQSVLRSRWDKISIPNNCRRPFVENSTVDNNIHSYRLISEDQEPPQVEVSKCLHGSQYYEHGTQWTSSLETCTMCHCNHGVHKCDAILCPPLTCAQKFTIPNSCCMSCHNITSLAEANTGSCFLGGQNFAPGSMWYPYIPPHGFSLCTVCNCNPTTLQVKCERISCPPLNCDERLAIRPENKSCCKVCPNNTKSVVDDLAFSDQLVSSTKSPRDILANGGCKYSYGGPYENGQSWTPSLYLHGPQKCVICRCKDSKVTCERIKCTRNNCSEECCMRKERCKKLRRSRETSRKREK